MALIVGVSGKIGSGKNYLTDRLRDELEGLGRTIEETSFAKPLKEELGAIIDFLRNNEFASEADKIKALSEEWDMSLEKAQRLIDLLTPELSIPGLNGWSRTLGVRSCLQVLGTEIRREQYPNYWTDKFLQEAENSEADYVFVSDGRFPNEIDCVIDNGGVTFRLDISDEVLEERRTSRDGITYTPEQLNHISETILDDYDRFDYYVGEVIEADFLAEIIEMRYRLR